MCKLWELDEKSESHPPRQTRRIRVHDTLVLMTKLGYYVDNIVIVARFTIFSSSYLGSDVFLPAVIEVLNSVKKRFRTLVVVSPSVRCWLQAVSTYRHKYT